MFWQHRGKPHLSAELSRCLPELNLVTPLGSARRQLHTRRSAANHQQPFRLRRRLHRLQFAAGLRD